VATKIKAFRVYFGTVGTIVSISGLAIQALKTIGRQELTPQETEKIQQMLSKEKPTRLQHDIRLAPVWIKQIMQPVLTKSLP